MVLKFSTRIDDVRSVRGQDRNKKRVLAGSVEERIAPKWKVTVGMVMANEDGASRRSLGSCQSLQSDSHQISREKQEPTPLT